MPLVSGYLQAYASTDQTVASEYCFSTYTTSIKTPYETILREVLSRDSDVYAISVYVWNSGLVRRLVADLRHARPRSQVILGGPQVMHHGLKYLHPADESVTICNTEGEVTFTEYLRALSDDVPDLADVAGLSFYRDGELIDTGPRTRIQDLNSIPSPILNGMIKPEYSIGIIETNRGCPYHCGFCYWGAATNDRVHRFDEDRVRDELTWMARNGAIFLYIADANWGMLARDVDLSEHIAECSRKYQLPSVVYFSSAKNKPHLVTRITGIFQDAGLVTSQPVSMQTLEPESLKIIRRDNIKLDAFRAVQDDLANRDLSSFIELIWPLPGETLESFRNGIDTLCQRNAQTIIAYSHLLLHNTPIYHNREELGLVTRPAGSGVADAEIVIATQQVTNEEFVEGMRFFYATHAIWNTRSLFGVANYLSSRGMVSFAELFGSFARYLRGLPADDPISDLVERSIRDALYYDIGNYGLMIHTVLHEHRTLFTQHLTEFVRQQPWWSNPMARALFEIDLINRPYVYSNTPLETFTYQFERIRLGSISGRQQEVAFDPALHGALRTVARLEPQGSLGSRFLVDYKRRQYPYMAAQSIDHNANYCHGMIEKVKNIVPLWRATSAD
jgi:hypothetical protein